MGAETRVLSEAYERLKGLVAKDIESGTIDLEMNALIRSLEGDPSFFPALANEIIEAILLGIPLEPWQKLWLVRVLQRVVTNDKAALALSGKTGKGAPKNEAKSTYIAGCVLEKIVNDPEVRTTTEAWEKVAKENHLAIDTVREYWTKMKDTVCCSRETELGLDGPEEMTVEAAVKATLRAKMKK